MLRHEFCLFKLFSIFTHFAHDLQSSTVGLVYHISVDKMQSERNVPYLTPSVNVSQYVLIDHPQLSPPSQRSHLHIQSSPQSYRQTVYSQINPYSNLNHPHTIINNNNSQNRYNHNNNNNGKCNYHNMNYSQHHNGYKRKQLELDAPENIPSSKKQKLNNSDHEKDEENLANSQTNVENLQTENLKLKHKLRSFAIHVQKQNLLIERLKQTKNQTIVDKDKIQIYSQNINTLNLKEIDILEHALNVGITKIKQARDKLLENKYLCIACCTNDKNVNFNGCNHVCLCDKCETKLLQKLCPICRHPYTKTIKLNF